MRCIIKMASVWKALLFFVIVADSAARRHPVYLYSAALIQHLADQSTGIFDCWIFRLSNDPNKYETMDKLLGSDELASIPKRVISSFETTERQPKLLLIFGDYHHERLKKLSSYLLLQEFENSVKIIVFHLHFSRNELFQINSIFVEAMLLDLIYIRTDRLEVRSVHAFYRELYEWHGPVAFHELFEDQTLHLAGHIVRILYKLRSIDTLIATKKNPLNGRVLEWIFSTIEHINGTFEMRQMKCFDFESEDECFRRQSVTGHTASFVFGLDVSIRR